MNTFVTIMLFVVIVFAITSYYLVAGMLESIFLKRHRIDEGRVVNTKLIFIKVLAGVVVLLLLYFVISATLSLFGIDHVGSIPRF